MSEFDICAKLYSFVGKKKLAIMENHDAFVNFLYHYGFKGTKGNNNLFCYVFNKKDVNINNDGKIVILLDSKTGVNAMYFGINKKYKIITYYGNGNFNIIDNSHSSPEVDKLIFYIIGKSLCQKLHSLVQNLKFKLNQVSNTSIFIKYLKSLRLIEHINNDKKFHCYSGLRGDGFLIIVINPKNGLNIIHFQKFPDAFIEISVSDSNFNIIREKNPKKLEEIVKEFLNNYDKFKKANEPPSFFSNSDDGDDDDDDDDGEYVPKVIRRKSIPDNLDYNELLKVLAEDGTVNQYSDEIVAWQLYKDVQKESYFRKIKNIYYNFDNSFYKNIWNWNETLTFSFHSEVSKDVPNKIHVKNNQGFYNYINIKIVNGKIQFEIINKIKSRRDSERNNYLVETFLENISEILNKPENLKRIIGGRYRLKYLKYKNKYLKLKKKLSV